MQLTAEELELLRQVSEPEPYMSEQEQRLRLFERQRLYLNVSILPPDFVQTPYVPQ